MSRQRPYRLEPVKAGLVARGRASISVSLLDLCCLLAMSALCGCAAQPQRSLPAPAAGSSYTVTDSQGNRLALTARPQRIVSLTPAVTEILYSIGSGDSILSDTPSCDFPPEAKRKPHIDPLTGSLESVLMVHPDLVIGQAHLTDRMIGLCRKAGLPTLVIDAPDFARTYASIRLIGQTVGQGPSADAVAHKLQGQIMTIRKTMQAVKQRPRVLMLYSTNPIYTTGPGSFIDEGIDVAGGTNIVNKPLPGDVISSEQVLLRQPEVIVCGAEEQAKIQQLPGWAAGVPAVRARRYFHPDAALERPCPRVADALKRLARFLHPEVSLQ